MGLGRKRPQSLCQCVFKVPGPNSLEAEATTKLSGTKKRSSQELKRDTKLVTLLRNAVESAQEDDGWSLLAHVGQHIANQASFDPRNYGYSRLGDLIRAMDLFEY